MQLGRGNQKFWTLYDLEIILGRNKGNSTIDYKSNSVKMVDFSLVLSLGCN